MKYDPVKRSLGAVFNTTPFLRKLFYHLLNLLLLRSWHIRKELRKLRNSLPAAPAILDAGSGFGQYDYTMSRQFPKAQITAVDVKQEQIDDCNAFFERIGRSDRVKFEYGDLTTYQQPDAYDLALSVDVMEHIEEDVTVFRNLAASLKKGGVLLISTPSDKGGSDVHDDHDDSFIEEHVRDGYAIEDIEAKLKTAGFTSVRSRYAYGTPGKISWRLSMKWPIRIANAGKLLILLLPFYYLVFYPFAFVLNIIDLHTMHKSGTGLIVTAIK
ncbi:MAG: class I SAM-dependent methyltransferase [Bacteroidales bacterium]|nr:class I SAM-dependent methyltransferase [Bacteroidales bacterium]MDT8430636.1 class I SAM-dependent methyltransferase [Bacteroidales bacterium]